jgi:hypothetical protein
LILKAKNMLPKFFGEPNRNGISNLQGYVVLGSEEPVAFWKGLQRCRLTKRYCSILCGN